MEKEKQTMRGHDQIEPAENCQAGSLRASEHFRHLSPAATKDFDAVAIRASYPAGAVLFIEKHEPRGVFLLSSGSVKLSVSSSCGKTLILRIAKPGEILGLMSTLSGAPYEVTAEALHPCTLSYVPRKLFLQFVAKHAEAYQGVVKQLSALYSGACEQLRTVGLSATVPEKLARVLLEWSAEAQPAPNRPKITLSFTHEEIAAFIGASRESVTRALSEFKSRELVALHGATLTISNRAALESVAGD
jgi:CRP/FNR family transcriptional regulator